MKKRCVSLLLGMNLFFVGCSTQSANANKQKSNWEISNFVDEFRDSTGDAVLQATFDGTFSNTATENSKLEVIVGYEDPMKDGCKYYSDSDTYLSNVADGRMIFRLYEYGDHLATYLNSDDIVLKIKTTTGKVVEYELYGEAPNGQLYTGKGKDQFPIGDLLDGFLAGDYYDPEKNRMGDPYDIPAIIQIGSYKYNFTISSKGYEEMKREYKKQKCESSGKITKK